MQVWKAKRINSKQTENEQIKEQKTQKRYEVVNLINKKINNDLKHR